MTEHSTFLTNKEQKHSYKRQQRVLQESAHILQICIEIIFVEPFAHTRLMGKNKDRTLQDIILCGKDSTITDKATIYLQIKTDAATQCAAASIFYECNQLIT